MMRIFIGQNEITNFHLEVPYTDTLDKTLDTFSFIIRDTNERTFQKYNRVRIVDSSINFEKIMALQSYTSKLEGNTWIYNIECISPTKILENIIINGMADTRSTSSLKNQLTRIVSKINKQSIWENGDRYTTITVNQHLQTFLNNRSGRDFKWDGQVNAREIFDDFLRPLDAYVIVTDFEVNTFVDMISGQTTRYIPNIYIDYVLMNGADIDDLTDLDHEIGRGTNIKTALQNIDNNLPDNYKIANFETLNDSEFDVSKVHSIAVNSVPDNYLTTGWTKARSESLGVWSSKNVCLITDEPIYDVDRDNFTAIVKCKMVVWYVDEVYDSYPWYHVTSATDPDFSWVGLVLPLGDYIYEKAEYDILPESVQRKALYFERGKKNIYGFTDMYKDNVVGQFDFTAIQNIISELENEIGNEYFYTDWNPTRWYIDYCEDMTDVTGNEQIFQVGKFFNATLNGDNVVTSYVLKDTLTPVNHSGFVFQEAENKNPNQLPGKHVGDIKTMQIYDLYSDLKSALYYCKYKPYVDSVVIANKKDNDGKNVDTGYTHGLSILQNQNSQNLDLNRFCNSQQSLINRLGERIAYLDLKINTSQGSTLWPLGDFIRVKPNANDSSLGDCWKIVQRELTQYNENTYKVRYTLAENFNANNASIDLDRTKRTFDIPLNGYVDRYILVKIPNDVDTSNFNSTLTRCTDYEGYTCYSWNNLCKFQSAGKKYFRTTLIDNYSANIYQTKISNKTVSAPLRYCGTDGTQTDLSISLTTSLNIETRINIIDLPRIPWGTNITAYSRTLFGVDKDPFEKIIIVFYQDIED